VAFNKSWIERDQLRMTAGLCEKSAYGQYLLKLIGESDDI
jgi:dTDP-glucose pyrophosphorylase